MKDTDLSKGNIFINGGETKKIGNLCLGGGAGSICMNNLNLNNFDETKYPIPVFRRNNTQVYYNHDQPSVIIINYVLKMEELISVLIKTFKYD